MMTVPQEWLDLIISGVVAIKEEVAGVKEEVAAIKEEVADAKKEVQNLMIRGIEADKEILTLKKNMKESFMKTLRVEEEIQKLRKDNEDLKAAGATSMLVAEEVVRIKESLKRSPS